jgi:soluble lytic murein transglycosylase-like protein
MTQRLAIHVVIIPLELALFAAVLVAGSWLVGGMWEAMMADGGRQVAAAPIPAGDSSAAPAALSPIFTPEVQYWAGKIAGWAAQYDLDPNLVATVMQIESCGGPSAVSRSGAQGLFQVMPFHFAEGDAMQDPDTNAGRGMAYLALGLARAGGNAGLALAGYNGGHSVIGRDSSLWSSETKRYWYWGTGIYEDAVSGQPSSARLQEWLAAGGASLCDRAAQELGIR